MPNLWMEITTTDNVRDEKHLRTVLLEGNALEKITIKEYISEKEVFAINFIQGEKETRVWLTTGQTESSQSGLPNSTNTERP